MKPSNSTKIKSLLRVRKAERRRRDHKTSRNFNFRTMKVIIVFPALHKANKVEKSRPLVCLRIIISCLNNHSDKIGKPIKNYLNLFIDASLNHMSIRSHLMSQSNNNLISNNEQLFNSIDSLPITFGITLSPNPRGKISTNSQINPGTMDENENSKVRTIKTLLVRQSIIQMSYKNHHKILKQKNYKWSTMAGNFNTTLFTELE